MSHRSVNEHSIDAETAVLIAVTCTKAVHTHLETESRVCTRSSLSFRFVG